MNIPANPLYEKNGKLIKNFYTIKGGRIFNTLDDAKIAIRTNGIQVIVYCFIDMIRLDYGAFIAYSNVPDSLAFNYLE